MQVATKLTEAVISVHKMVSTTYESSAKRVLEVWNNVSLEKQLYPQLTLEENMVVVGQQQKLR